MNPMKILASLILSASLATASEIPVGHVAIEQLFATRSGSQFVNTNLQTYDGKILVIMLMTPWCPFCQSNASAVGDGLLSHFNSSSRGILTGKNAHGVPIESVLLSTEEAAQWDSVNASFASSNGFGKWGLDANAIRGNPRRLLGYFRGGFINSSNLYSWGEDRRRVIVLNMVRNSGTHEYREIVINQNSYSSGDNATAREAIDAIQPRSVSIPAAITTQPVSTAINRGQSATLTVTATGDDPLNYAWFLGTTGDTSQPVGANDASFTTPALTATTSFWVRVSNAANLTGEDSATATITVLQPAAITASPASVVVKIGQTTTLSVTASGDGLLRYQWYEGASGVTSTPVGSNSPTFTTPGITETKNYWVRVTNAANPAGADSAAASVSVLKVTPPYAHALSLTENLVTVSSRGLAGSTYLGWDTFNEALDRDSPIQDGTPDLGTNLAGAFFQTTNEQDHVLEDGNFFFDNGSLAEQIIVPTAGTVGSAGFTTLVLQIAAIPGTGPFPAVITLNSINDRSPTVVQAVNAWGDGQLWAKWDLPGHQASYTITMTGPTNQAGFSFDKVIVDTHYSATTYLPDSVAALPPEIRTAANLQPRLVGVNMSQQMEATGGTAPYQFVVSAGSLPAGCSLSSAGLITGAPMSIGTSNFTVKVTDADVLIGSKALSLTVTTAPQITTSSPLTAGLLSSSYDAAFLATGGTAPYTYALSAGALPAGITLSETGILSGTPTETGTSSFTVELRDQLGFTSTKDFSLRVSNLSLLTPSLLTAVKRVAFSHTLRGNGGTAPYTWSLSRGSLPAGLSLSPAGVISGAPGITAATSTFLVSLADNTGLAVTRELTLAVSDVFIPPVLEPISFPTLTIGSTFSHTLAAQNQPKTFVVTGLPSGVTFSATTGVISGRPRVSGLYNVQVRAINAGGSSAVVTTPLVIRALDAQRVGSFGGLVNRHPNVNRDLGGVLTVSTTSTGSYTLRLVGALANNRTSTAATVTSITGFLAATAPQITSSLGGQPLLLTFNPQNGQLSGTLGAAGVDARRSTWNAIANPAETRVGYYSLGMELANARDRGLATIPQGAGFATFNVSLAGTLTAAGKTADGQSFISASFIAANGAFYAYAPLYRNAGSIQGPLQITEDTQGHFAGNAITGSMTWLKPTTTGRAYAAAFGPLDLQVTGAYLAPASRGNIILGLPGPGNVDLKFSDGGLANSETDPDLSFVLMDNYKPDFKNAFNPGKVTITLNPATGAVTGTFSLIENNLRLLRSKITFQGQVVRTVNGNSKVFGYFLLPQIPASGQAASLSQILSGGFTLE